MKSNLRFWIFYTLAWLLYAASLTVVFTGLGNQFDFALTLQTLCNVAPAYLLGIGVVFLCRRLSWNRRATVFFIAVHLVSLPLFALLWMFLTWLDLSILTFLQKGIWNFVVWDKYAAQWQIFTGLMAYLTIASAVYVGETNADLQAEMRRNAELEIRAALAEAARNEADLFAIRAQLNPHFLFNTLHSLMALVRNDAGKAEAAIEKFALMLRYVLHSQTENQTNKTDVTFADEWRFIQNYLELETLRLGDRLKVESEIETEALNFKLPAFAVQPLVENSIKHAISPNKNGGKIRIAAQVLGERLHIEISDDGKGARLGEVEANGGRGLRLARESLMARFGSAAVFDYETAPDAGFTVKIEIPKSLNGAEKTG